MAHLSDYTENKIIEHILGKTAFTMPQPWLALFSAAPSDTGGGSEISGNGYARLLTTAGNWATASNGSSSNADNLTFNSASAQWATVTAFGAYDSASGGNLLWWNTLAANVSITAGSQPRFSAGALTVSLD